MHVDKMKLCTRVRAPQHTLYTSIFTGLTIPKFAVRVWLDINNILDYELIAEDDGDHGPLYVFYFVHEQDAIWFMLRWG